MQHISSQRAAERAGRVRAEQSLRAHSLNSGQQPPQGPPSLAVNSEAQQDAANGADPNVSSASPHRADETASASSSAAGGVKGGVSSNKKPSLALPLTPIGYAVSCFTQRWVQMTDLAASCDLWCSLLTSIHSHTGTERPDNRSSCRQHACV